MARSVLVPTTARCLNQRVFGPSNAAGPERFWMPCWRENPDQPPNFAKAISKNCIGLTTIRSSDEIFESEPGSVSDQNCQRGEMLPTLYLGAGERHMLQSLLKL